MKLPSDMTIEELEAEVSRLQGIEFGGPEYDALFNRVYRELQERKSAEQDEPTFITPVIVVCPECGQHSSPLDPSITLADVLEDARKYGGYMYTWETIEGWLDKHKTVHEEENLVEWGEDHAHKITRVAVPNTGGSGENPDYMVECSCGVKLGQNYAGDERIFKHLFDAKAGETIR